MVSSLEVVPARLRASSLQPRRRSTLNVSEIIVEPDYDGKPFFSLIVFRRRGKKGKEGKERKERKKETLFTRCSPQNKMRIPSNT